MSLSMLVGGADCGPVNPLQGLSKQFDRDRGLQQDHFGSARAGSSKEVFRSQYHTSPGTDRDAAQFFATNQPTSGASAPAPYDLSALHTTLPTFQPVHMPAQSPPVIMNQAPAAWAADFMQHQSIQSPVGISDIVNQAQQAPQPQSMSLDVSQVQRQWMPSIGLANRVAPLPYQSYATSQPPQLSQTLQDSQWDEAFMTHDALSTIEHIENAPETQRPKIEDPDELARAAGKVIDAVQHEQNPKFKNSQFLGLMKQIRDREVVVEGDKMIPKEEATGLRSDPPSSVDVKGKGRAADAMPVLNTFSTSSAMPVYAPSILTAQRANVSERAEVRPGMDGIDAYFQQENESYISYWHGVESQQPSQQKVGLSAQSSRQGAEWDQLQQDWDRFEATATGLRATSNYQFQANNPYVVGEASKTRHHAMHGGLNSISESVLELEAAVLRDPHNATAWFELGVKQQQNERELKALFALREAAKLDPSYLPTWLALAVTYTNDGNRSSAYSAVEEWVSRNNRYAAAVEAYRATHVVDLDDMMQDEKFSYLIDCLIAMARSDTSGQIDADIQIALAILLNANEAYDKATDCFQTALAVRPEDWQLYNRVGATLANSGQPEEALQYYYRALELNPAYIRARFNLGISCINLRRYQEASQHILDALVLQESDSVTEPDGTQNARGVGSSALWDSLKTCCLHMQRIDLATICDRQDLDAFRFNYQIQ